MCIQLWRDLTSLILSLPIQKHVYPSINSELLLLSSIKFDSILQRQREGGRERQRGPMCRVERPASCQLRGRSALPADACLRLGVKQNPFSRPSSADIAASQETVLHRTLISF